MGFHVAIRTCLRKYVTFSGRASRSEYWWFILFTCLGSAVAAALDGFLFGTTTLTTAPGQVSVEADGMLASLFALAVFLPTISAGWRRMHDTGRTGFYLFYPLIVTIGIITAFSFFGGLGMIDGPGMSAAGEAMFGIAALILVPAIIVAVISPLLVLWWLTRPSEPRTNAFGPNPHEVLS